MTTEEGVCIESRGERLIGVLHRPQAAALGSRPGVVIVVGGPQYRVGSHRQFVLLARALAARGFPVLRFDLSGMGDSGGEFAGFERSGADIRAAIDALQHLDKSVGEVCLWGLCDGASAALMYVPTDTRVSQLVLSILGCAPVPARRRRTWTLTTGASCGAAASGDAWRATLLPC